MKIYKSFICKKCKKSFILINDEIDKNRYLRCPHCSSKNIKIEKDSDNLRDCLKHSAYRKEHGALRQVRYE